MQEVREHCDFCTYGGVCAATATRTADSSRRERMFAAAQLEVSAIKNTQQNQSLHTHIVQIS